MYRWKDAVQNLPDRNDSRDTLEETYYEMDPAVRKRMEVNVYAEKVEQLKELLKAQKAKELKQSEFKTRRTRAQVKMVEEEDRVKAEAKGEVSAQEVVGEQASSEESQDEVALEPSSEAVVESSDEEVIEKMESRRERDEDDESSATDIEGVLDDMNIKLPQVIQEKLDQLNSNPGFKQEQKILTWMVDNLSSKLLSYVDNEPAFKELKPTDRVALMVKVPLIEQRCRDQLFKI